ncbi:MAG: HAD-IA family hydrolase [Candidatus Nanohaloarchaeota archaeon]|nr:HAD-IA family hydrolase [Candidatus Nanohaloarchaeota archaeon]
MYKAVVFDLDGTLIESVPQYVNAFKQALKAYGFEKEAEKHNIARLLGKPSYDIIKILLPNKEEETIKQVHKKFLEITTSEEFRKSIELKPSAHEILSFLKKRKIKLFILSGSGKKNLDYFLERFKIKHYFIEVVHGEMEFKRKPDPEALHYLMKKHDLKKEEVLYVGDGELDYLLAKNAEVRFIGVRSEVIDEEFAIKHKHALIYCLEELKRYFLKRVIAVVGMAGSGKSSFIDALTRIRSMPVVYFGSITFEVMKGQGFESEKEAREWLRKQHGMEAYAKLSLPKIKEKLEKSNDVLIDGLYSWEEYLYLKEELANHAYVILVAVVAPRELRYYRLAHRNHRPFTREKAYLRDISEVNNLNKALPIVMADFYVLNAGSKDKLNEDSDIFVSVVL